MNFSSFLEKIDISDSNFYFPKTKSGKTQLSINQVDIFNGISNYQFNIIYKERCSGTSTIIALYSLWYLLTNKNKTAIFLSTRNERINFKQLINQNYIILDNLGLKSVDGLHSINDTHFSNNSKILYRPTSSQEIRGYMADLIIMHDFHSPVWGLSKLDKRSQISNAFPSLRHRKGKLIIVTENLKDKDEIFGKENVEINEIYGYYFNGKRKILIEKTNFTPRWSRR